MISPANPTLSTDLGAIRGTGPVLRTMRRFLRHLDRGSLRLTLPDGAVIDHAGTEPGPHGELVLHRWRICCAAIRARAAGATSRRTMSWAPRSTARGWMRG